MLLDYACLLICEGVCLQILGFLEILRFFVSLNEEEIVARLYEEDVVGRTLFKELHLLSREHLEKLKDSVAEG